MGVAALNDVTGHVHPKEYAILCTKYAASVGKSGCDAEALPPEYRIV